MSEPNKPRRRASGYNAVPLPQQVVVGGVKTPRALQRVHEAGWYHIPVRSAPR